MKFAGTSDKHIRFGGVFFRANTRLQFACRRQPFRANSANELLTKHLRDTPSPPTSYEKSITPEYSDLVLRMLRKKPADRPRDFQEILSLFSRVRIFKDEPAPVPGPMG